MPMRAGSAHATLICLVDLVRDYAEAEGLGSYTRSWATRDGSVRIDYVADVMVRVTFAGDAPARSYVLAHDWPGCDALR